jgi:hypothetical protein
MVSVKALHDDLSAQVAVADPLVGEAPSYQVELAVNEAFVRSVALLLS